MVKFTSKIEKIKNKVWPSKTEGSPAQLFTMSKIQTKINTLSQKNGNLWNNNGSQHLCIWTLFSFCSIASCHTHHKIGERERVREQKPKILFLFLMCLLLPNPFSSPQKIELVAGKGGEFRRGRGVPPVGQLLWRKIIHKESCFTDLFNLRGQTERVGWLWGFEIKKNKKGRGRRKKKTRTRERKKWKRVSLCVRRERERRGERGERRECMCWGFADKIKRMEPELKTQNSKERNHEGALKPVGNARVGLSCGGLDWTNKIHQSVTFLLSHLNHFWVFYLSVLFWRLWSDPFSTLTFCSGYLVTTLGLLLATSASIFLSFLFLILGKWKFTIPLMSKKISWLHSSCNLCYKVSLPNLEGEFETKLGFHLNYALKLQQLSQSWVAE